MCIHTYTEDGWIYETVGMEKHLSAARYFSQLVCQMSTCCFSVLAPLPRHFQGKKYYLLFCKEIAGFPIADGVSSRNILWQQKCSTEEHSPGVLLEPPSPQWRFLTRTQEINLFSKTQL